MCKYSTPFYRRDLSIKNWASIEFAVPKRLEPTPHHMKRKVFSPIPWNVFIFQVILHVGHFIGTLLMLWTNLFSLSVYFFRW